MEVIDKKRGVDRFGVGPFSIFFDHLPSSKPNKTRK